MNVIVCYQLLRYETEEASQMDLTNCHDSLVHKDSISFVFDPWISLLAFIMLEALQHESRWHR